MATTKAKREQDAAIAEAQSQDDGLIQTKTKLAADILKTVGKPRDFERLDIHHLWDGRFRANFRLVNDDGQRRLGASHFIRLSPGGEIISAEPPLTNHN